MDERKMQYARMFAEMLKVPTVTNVDKSVFDRLHAVMADIAPRFAALPTAYPRNSAMVVKWQGKAHDRPLVIMAHQDVVPEGEPDKWKYPPYGGVIAEDRIWGRGALDCKSHVFASMMAAEQLMSQGYIPNQDVYFCYGDDEETSGGGAAAEAAYLRENGVTPAMVIDEGGGMILQSALPKFLSQSVGVIGVSERGQANYKFTAPSRGGHSSMPPKNSPFVRLARLVVYCEDHRIFKRQATPVLKQTLRQAAKAFKPVLRPVVRIAHRFIPLVTALAPKLSGQINAFVQSNMVFTMAQGAKVGNNIPDNAYMVANVRYSHQEGKDKVLPKLQKIADKFKVQVEVLDSRDASPIADIHSAEYAMAVAAVNKTFGPTVLAPYVMPGGTDCRYLQDLCPTALRFSPFLVSLDEMNRQHGYDECMPIDALYLGVEFYGNLIKDFC